MKTNRSRATKTLMRQLFVASAGIAVTAPVFAQDAALGMKYWNSGRQVAPLFTSCAACHGAPLASGGLKTLETMRMKVNTQAAAITLINDAIKNDLIMRASYGNGVLSAQDVADLAAYIVPTPSSPPPASPPPASPPPASPPPASPSPAPTPTPPPSNGGTSTIAPGAPGAISFITTSVGMPSNVQKLTITNSGTTKVTFASPLVQTLPGAVAPDDFIANDIGVANSGTTCGATFSLDPQQSCTIGVTFRPTKEGPRSSQWRINFSTPVMTSQVQLSGTGAPAASSDQGGIGSTTPTSLAALLATLLYVGRRRQKVES